MLEPRDGEQPAQAVMDVDQLIREWAERWAEERGSELDKVDLTGESCRKSHRLKPEIHKLSATCAPLDEVEFKTALEEAKKDKGHSTVETLCVATESHTCRKSTPDKVDFKLSKERTTQHQLTFRRGFKVGAGISFSFGAPLVADLKINVNTELSLDKTKSTVEGEKKTWISSRTIHCEPNKVTTAKLVVTQQQTEVSFEQEVVLSGYVVVRCKKPVKFPQAHPDIQDDKAHHRWAVPIHQVFRELCAFRQPASIPGFKIDESEHKVIFELQGTFRYEEGIASEVVVEAHDLPQQLESLDHPPEVIRERLLAFYRKQLAIRRLFYPEIPVDKYYINLSVVTAEQHKRDVNDFSRLSKERKSQLISEEELLQSQQHLFGHKGESVKPEEMLTYGQFRFRQEGEGDQDFTHKKILLSGTAGIGKSVFSKYLPHLWSRGVWGNQYQWVFRIALRNLRPEVSQGIAKSHSGEVGSLADAASAEAGASAPSPRHTLQLMDVIIQECLNERGITLNASERALFEAELTEQHKAGKLLLILDGYDEIEAEESADIQDFLKNTLRDYRVILTSRPSNLEGLFSQDHYHFQPTLHLEVTGFNPEDVNQYIDRFFEHIRAGDKRENMEAELKNLVEHHPTIGGMCQIPINAELLCTAWLDQDFSDALSISQLYEHVLISSCYRHLVRVRAPQVGKKHALLRSMLFEQCKAPLGILEYLGWVSIRDQELFIDLGKSLKALLGDRLTPKAVEEIMDTQNHFGFIKPKRSRGTFKAMQSYYFNHLTFRDYFASRYIASWIQSIIGTDHEHQISAYDHQFGSAEQLKEFIRSHQSEASFEIVLWLIAGQLMNVGDKQGVQAYLSMILDQQQDMIGYHRAILLVRILDELQDKVNELEAEGLGEQILAHTWAWLSQSFNPNHRLFFHERNAQGLWSRYRLSPWLCRSRWLKDQLLTWLKTAPSESLHRLVGWLATINDSTMLESILLPLLDALGSSTHSKHAIEQNGQRLGRWIESEQKSLINTLKGIISETPSSENEARQIVAFQAIAIASIRAREGAPEWIAPMVDLVKQTPSTDNETRQIAAIQAIASACPSNKEWMAPMVGLLKQPPSPDNETRQIAAIQAIAIAIVGTSDVAQEWMPQIVEILKQRLSTDNEKRQIAAIEAIAIASVRFRDSIRDWLQPMLDLLKQLPSPENETRQIAAIHATATAAAIASVRFRDNTKEWIAPIVEILRQTLSTDNKTRQIAAIQAMAIASSTASIRSIAVALKNAKEWMKIILDNIEPQQFPEHHRFIWLLNVLINQNLANHTHVICFLLLHEMNPETQQQIFEALNSLAHMPDNWFYRNPFSAHAFSANQPYQAILAFLLDGLYREKTLPDFSSPENAEQFNAFPLDQPVNVVILNTLLKDTPEAFLWEKVMQQNHKPKHKSCRQNLLTILLMRSMQQGKAIYVREGHIHVYQNKRYVKIPISPLSVEQFEADCAAVSQYLNPPDRVNVSNIQTISDPQSPQTQMGQDYTAILAQLQIMNQQLQAERAQNQQTIQQLTQQLQQSQRESQQTIQQLTQQLQQSQRESQQTIQQLSQQLQFFNERKEIPAADWPQGASAFAHQPAAASDSSSAPSQHGQARSPGCNWVVYSDDV